jgi:CheY-like chemotaxis protein
MTDNPSSAGTGSRPKILVVDDDRDLIDLYSMQLRSLGYDVSAVSSGEDALDLLKTDTPFALLLTDVGLGGNMDGQATANAARQLRPSLPIIFMSGYTPHFHTGSDSMAEGVTFLQKPFRKKQLGDALAEVLGGTPT